MRPCMRTACARHAHGMRTACGLEGRQHRFEEIRVGHRMARRTPARDDGTTASGTTRGELLPGPPGLRPVEKGTTMGLVLWIIAAILVIWGIVSLIRGQVLMGAVLIVVGLLVGPGGVSIFT